MSDSDGDKKRKRSDAGGAGAKRAPSAFLLFSADERPKIKAAHPELKMTDIAKRCGELWKGIPDNIREKYNKLAAEKKAAFTAAGGGAAAGGKGKASKAKKAKKPGPKRITAFMLFMNEKRPEIRSQFPELKITEVAKRGGELWNALSDAEKQIYQQRTTQVNEAEKAKFEAANKRSARAADEDDEEEEDEEEDDEDDE